MNKFDVACQYIIEEVWTHFPSKLVKVFFRDLNKFANTRKKPNSSFILIKLYTLNNDFQLQCAKICSIFYFVKTFAIYPFAIILNRYLCNKSVIYTIYANVHNVNNTGCSSVLALRNVLFMNAVTRISVRKSAYCVISQSTVAVLVLSSIFT